LKAIVFEQQNEIFRSINEDREEKKKGILVYMNKHFHLIHYVFSNFDAAAQNGKMGLKVWR
jgi:hypothetical protein